MLRFIRITFFVYVLFLFSGCATVISGSHQYVKFEEHKTAKEAVINEEEVRVKRQLIGPAYVTNPKDKGHKKKLKKQFNEVAFLNFVILPFWMVDFLTGAIIKYKEN